MTYAKCCAFNPTSAGNGDDEGCIAHPFAPPPRSTTESIAGWSAAALCTAALVASWVSATAGALSNSM